MVLEPHENPHEEAKSFSPGGSPAPPLPAAPEDVHVVSLEKPVRRGHPHILCNRLRNQDAVERILMAQR